MNGVAAFRAAECVVAIGGIGEKFAHRAAEVAIEYAQPKQLISAGVAGAISPKLKVGDVGHIREVVDAATGTRYPGVGGELGAGDIARRLRTSRRSRSLLTKHAADVVDMEAAAVAQVATRAGDLKFAAIKAISDEAAFDMPPLDSLY